GDKMLAAGGDPRLRSIKDLGQEVTPLKRALRRDAAEAIVRLLDAGVAVQGDDPSGRTSMHIAAYEGAAGSVAVLLRLGADINERTPVQRNTHHDRPTTFEPADELRARERGRRSECHGLRR